mgnify:CR=1 FL=1
MADVAALLKQLARAGRFLYDGSETAESQYPASLAQARQDMGRALEAYQVYLREQERWEGVNTEGTGV